MSGVLGRITNKRRGKNAWERSREKIEYRQSKILDYRSYITIQILLIQSLSNN